MVVVNSLYIRKFCTIFFYEKTCKVVYYLSFLKNLVSKLVSENGIWRNLLFFSDSALIKNIITNGLERRVSVPFLFSDVQK